METTVTREQALALLKKYNKEPFHLEHALTLEGVLGWYAQELGYGEDAAFWRLAGLLHDVDFECYPEQHCQKAPELLQEVDASPELVHAICSHAYGICSDVEPQHEMEKVLFAVDELTEVFETDFDDFFCIRHDEKCLGCEDGEDLNKGIVMVVAGVNLLMGAAHMDNVFFGFLQSAVVFQTVDDGFFIAFIRIKMCCLDQVVFAGI